MILKYFFMGNYPTIIRKIPQIYILFADKTRHVLLLGSSHFVPILPSGKIKFQTPYETDFEIRNNRAGGRRAMHLLDIVRSDWYDKTYHDRRYYTIAVMVGSNDFV